ncbi:MAG: prolipoprotein diacylglyceryl transferase [Bacteroidales bacterium]|jgi:prolipoprotein diacylglyceryl transferase|nr:prolipoprotein diacylglyceryl transferase [Bacteroidales bacterium]
MINILNYIIWNADPILFEVGSLRVGWYGLLLLSGFGLAYFTFQKVAKHEKVDLNLIDRFSFLTAAWTIVGIRLGHCLFYDWAYYKDHLLEIFIPFTQTESGWEFTGFAGLASHGGTIAILLFVLYFSKRHNMSLVWLLDRLSIAIPIAAAFVRIGNLMNSEIIGTITDMSWGFIFMQREGTSECCDPRHPTQIYEALVYLSLFVYQVWYYFKKTKGHIPAGRSVGTLLVVIFTARFFIEFVKENQVGFEENMLLNMGQWLSIPFVLLGAGFLYYSFAKKTFPTMIKSETKDPKKKE